MSNLTKQHFVALAGALKNARPYLNAASDEPNAYRSEAGWRAAWLAWCYTVHQVLLVCQDSNRLFDREKFLHACDISADEWRFFIENREVNP